MANKTNEATQSTQNENKQRSADPINASGFVRNMICGIGSNNAYTLKRSLGSTLTDCSIQELIAFLKCSPRGGKSERKLQDVEFIVAGLFYNTQKSFESVNENKVKVKYETLIRRLVRDRKSATEEKISYLLSNDIDDSGLWHSRFRWLHNQAKTYIAANEMIDYVSLLYDLYKWNNPDKERKIKWAEAIYLNNN